VGRKVASLDLSHSNHIQDIKRRRENHISFGKAETARGNDNDDGTVGIAPPSNCEPNVDILSREHSKVYVRCFNPLRTSTNTGENENQRHLGNKIESGKDADIAVGFGNCSNSGTINELQASFGDCAELASWEALRGEMNSLEKRAILFTRTLALPMNPEDPLTIKNLCVWCRKVSERMFCNKVAVIYSWL